MSSPSHINTKNILICAKLIILRQSTIMPSLLLNNAKTLVGLLQVFQRQLAKLSAFSAASTEERAYATYQRARLNVTVRKLHEVKREHVANDQNLSLFSQIFFNMALAITGILGLDNQEVNKILRKFVTTLPVK